VIFDATPPVLEFRAVAFHEPRRVAVLVGGAPLTEVELGTDWATYRVELPAGQKHTVALRTPGCTRPFEVGLGRDRRCLSFKLAGLPLARLELFDLAGDPEATRDLSLERPDLVRLLVRELKKYPEKERFAATETALSDEQVKTLKALGYLQ